MLEINLAYLAGIWDGEGSIYLTKPHSGKNCKYIQLGTYIGMQNTKALELALELFPTKRSIVFSQTSGVHRIFYWGFPAAEVLKTLLPYLRVKQDQAQLALHFQELRKPNNRHHYTEEERARDEAMRLQMRELNRRDREPFYRGASN